MQRITPHMSKLRSDMFIKLRERGLAAPITSGTLVDARSW
jgi:hypothetical protein